MICGRICPTLDKLRGGTIILGCDREPEPGKTIVHEAYLSADSGGSWEGPIRVASAPHLWLNEGTYVQLSDGVIVCYLAESKEAACAYKAISRDGGKTWEGPFPTLIISCRGRPKAALLRSGEVAMTYGFGRAPRQLMLHVEMQSTAVDPEVARKMGDERFLVRRFPISYDRSIHPDGGYSGWVQLPSGDLFVVDYIVDDAPMAHIRTYQLNRSDWILCPEGQLIYHLNRQIGHHERACRESEELFKRLCDSSGDG